MLWIDILILVVIGFFAIYGFKVGFVKALVSFFGIILASFLASEFYMPVSSWLIDKTGWGENFSRVLVFILILILITRLVDFIFWIIAKIFHIVTWIPFTNSINKFLGLFFGLIEGFVVISLIIFFIEKFPLAESVMNFFDASLLAPFLSWVASLLIQFIPGGLL